MSLPSLFMIYFLVFFSIFLVTTNFRQSYSGAVNQWKESADAIKEINYLMKQIKGSPKVKLLDCLVKIQIFI